MAAPAPARPVFVVAAVVLAGFVGATAVGLVRGQATAPDDVKAIMTGLVDPAADGIWNSHGSITTATSDESWAPATDADWRRLWWVRVDGRASRVGGDAGAEAALRAKYPPYRSGETPLYAGDPALLRIEPVRVVGWAASPAACELPSETP